MNDVEIEMAYDFICPWCWIGHRNLKLALQEAGLPDTIQPTFTPFELNPDMPPEGMDRRAYRTAKFGSWARSQAMDAQVTQLGKQVGLAFNYDRVNVTPNTRLAHRLMMFAAQSADSARVDALFEAIFAAYFSNGENIGRASVLARVAASVGFDAAEVERDLLGDQDLAAFEARLEAVRDGIRAVPSFRVGRHLVQGAQPPEILSKALRTLVPA